MMTEDVPHTPMRPRNTKTSPGASLLPRCPACNHEWRLQPAASALRICSHCDVSLSSDAGLTWEHRRLSSMLRSTGNAHLAALPRPEGTAAPRIAGMFAASGAGCALTSGPFAGRLLQPYVLRIDGRIDVACAYSDDKGQTWRLGSPISHTLRAHTCDDNNNSRGTRPLACPIPYSFRNWVGGHGR